MYTAILSLLSTKKTLSSYFENTYISKKERKYYLKKVDKLFLYYSIYIVNSRYLILSISHKRCLLRIFTNASLVSCLYKYM